MLSARYLLRDTEQQGDNAGLRVPYLPRHYLLLGSQWSLPDRWLLGASALYQSSRYQDDLNLDLLKSGWAFGVTAYWETVDKRHALQMTLDNLLTDKKAAIHPDPRWLIKYTARF